MEQKEKISLLKLAQNYDEEFKPTDIPLEEIKKVSKDKKKINQKFKDDYFAFYDDVKCSSRKKQDW